ncbi:MAG TPA: type VI secretion system baseplate subunit TssE [Caulobacteraceae bacterium]|nr:type VI secretion system baseplate subunit TssE [Caulobacteraceae bacterium]
MAARPVNLLPSVLDRLIDDHPDSPHDPPKSRPQQLASLRDSVRRDLEALLNHHRRCLSPPPGLGELDLSVVEYGAPDFLSLFAGEESFREQFRRSLEDIIRRYEPRFVSVKVTIKHMGDSVDRTLKFRIDAMMYAEPAPEPVSFDSRLDPASQAFAVSGGADG